MSAAAPGDCGCSAAESVGLGEKAPVVQPAKAAVARARPPAAGFKPATRGQRGVGSAPPQGRRGQRDLGGRVQAWKSLLAFDVQSAGDWRPAAENLTVFMKGQRRQVK